FFVRCGGGSGVTDVVERLLNECPTALSHAMIEEDKGLKYVFSRTFKGPRTSYHLAMVHLELVQTGHYQYAVNKRAIFVPIAVKNDASAFEMTAPNERHPSHPP